MQVFAGRVGSSRLRVNPYPYVTCDMPLSTMRGHKLPRSNRAGPNDIMLYCSGRQGTIGHIRGQYGGAEQTAIWLNSHYRYISPTGV